MKRTKRLLAISLVLIMLFQSIPLVYATDGASDYTADNETSISAENGMGQIIENLTETQQEEENEYTGGYSILDITFENGIAYVDVNVASQCTLIVAIYDENTAEMLYSATEKLDASVFSEEIKHDIISVDMGVSEMPLHFLMKAFILDKNNNALCKNFVCRTYTSAYEIFMETTPDDFEGKEIVNLDYNNDDFGVLVDNAIISERSDVMPYTYNDGIYTFFNATEEVKNLKADDIFYYQLSNEIGDFLLIKVKEITVDGTTVTITEDEEIALGDAFQFFRIDEDADFSDVEMTEENLGSALSFEEQATQPQLFANRRSLDASKDKSWSTTLNVEYPPSDENKDPSNENKDPSDANKDPIDSGIEITGSIKYTITANISIYYDIRFGDDFYEFKTELTHEVGLDIKFTGKIESNKEYFKIDFPDIPLGAFIVLDIIVYPVLSAEASLTFGGSLEIYNRLSYTDANGLSKTNDTKWWGLDGDFGKTEIEITAGLGVDCDVGFKKGKEDKDGLSTIHAAVTLSAEFGLKGTLTPSLIGAWLDKHHDCIFCMDGELSVFIEGKAKIDLKIITDKLKWSWDIIELKTSWAIGDCYFSISGHGVKFGMGTCPYISHKVTIFVYDENGNPVKDAVVSTTTGYCDADGDKKFNETSMLTDECGQAIFYFTKGYHEVLAEKDGIGTSGQQFEILAMEKEINLELFDAEYFNGHFYKLFDDGLNWFDAKFACEKMGGHLITINTKDENDFITGTLKESATKYCYWTAIMYDFDLLNWVHYNGDVIEYQNWADNEPNDWKNNNEAYVHLYGKRFTGGIGIKEIGEWNDVTSEGAAYAATIYALNQFGYICEWEAIPSNNQVALYRMSSYNLEQTQTSSKVIINGTTATRNDTLKDTEYVLAVIKDENAVDLLSSDNLLYIDQKTAEGSSISFEFIVPEGIIDYHVKIFGISHSHTADNSVTENEIKATCTANGSYESVTYCAVCDKELSRETVITNKLGHTEKTVSGKNATCTQDGLTDGVVCDLCNEILFAQEVISTLGHIDENGDYHCDNDCGYVFEMPPEPDSPENNCTHICHKDGLLGFIWKIVNFINKIFKINKSCYCGINHW